MKTKTLIWVAAVTALTLSSAAAAEGGKPLFDRLCAGCHRTGLGGAPKLGDKAAWAPRIARGTDSLLATVLAGKGMMPKKGGCDTCSKADLRATIEYMVQQAKK